MRTPPGAEDRLSRVGVVIVTWNSAKTIAATLGALPLESIARCVVVDNASSDGTSCIVSSIEAVALDQVERNLGFARACNRGAAKLPATIDVCVFVNPDAVVTGATLSDLVAYLDEHPRCGVVSPSVRRDGEPQASAWPLPTLATEMRHVLPPRIAGIVRRPEPMDEAGPVGRTEGACLAVRREAWREVGGFDERFFLFFEEPDFAREAGRRGWTTDLCRTAVIDHVVGVSRSHVEDAARAYYVHSAVRYLRKWHGPTAVIGYRTVALASWLLRSRFGQLDRSSAARLIDALFHEPPPP